MSSLIIEICKIQEKVKLENSDNLSIFHIKGWQVVGKTDSFEKNDLVVFFPADTVLPSKLSDRLGVTKYLKPLPMIRGVRADGGRVRVANLRGVKSYGLIMKPDENWAEGYDVASYYEVTKFEQVETCTDGDAAKKHPYLEKYTDIENLRNFPNVFSLGEEVVCSEKADGRNNILALLLTANEDGEANFQFHCASHHVARKKFDKEGRISDFWVTLQEPETNLLNHLCNNKNNVILYGEQIGTQKLRYGLKPGELKFLCFDIKVNGMFLNFDERYELCERFGVAHVPILYRGPYSKEKIEEYTNGSTTICDPDKAGDFKGREGVVIVPVIERISERLRGDGRVILKSVSFDYLNNKY